MLGYMDSLRGYEYVKLVDWLAWFFNSLFDKLTWFLVSFWIWLYLLFNITAAYVLLVV